MTGWVFAYADFQPEREGQREALCTLGNGYVATRGAAAERAADGVHYPGTYLAGCYNRLKTDLAGRSVWNEDLVNVPSWLPLTLRVDEDDWLDLRNVDILAYRQELQFAGGILFRAFRYRDGKGRETAVTARRLVHMAHPHLFAMETAIEPLNWSGRLHLRSALDGRVINGGVARYRELNSRHLEPLEAEAIGDDTLYIKVRTVQSHVEIALAARTRLFRGGEPVLAEREAIIERGSAAHELTVAVGEDGGGVTVEKIGAIYTSRDRAITECGVECRKATARAGRFEPLAQSHGRAWEHLWRRYDIGTEVEGEDDPDAVERILRLHIFHLLQTVSPNSIDLDVGVPARGLHGEAYRGHIFWDELFVFPILNLRTPEITRALLLYRYRRLPEARQAAAEAGLRGACFPWQSGSNGREETQQVHLNPQSGRWIHDRSHRQRHVNSAIAYNVWQYYQASGDIAFLSSFGAEMILEIARFWASMATYNGDLDRYEIRGVMGPDEYHDGYPGAPEGGLDNNTYTNVMAVWVLWRALDVLELLPPDRREELCATLQTTPEEITRWEEISRKMRLVFHEDGILTQFEGYEALDEFDWEGYRKRYGDIQRLDRILEAEGDTPNRYKLSKQADVLMLCYLFSNAELGALLERLGYRFDVDSVPRTIDYYLERTSHGSTLSRVVHSWVLARSDRARSWDLFTEALQSDVADVQGGTTPEGIHLGAMAGTLDLIQRCYTGIEVRGGVLWLNPLLPDKLACLRLRLQYRGHGVELEITHERLRLRAIRSAAPSITIGFREEVVELAGGQEMEFDLADARER